MYSMKTYKILLRNLPNVQSRLVDIGKEYLIFSIQGFCCTKKPLEYKNRTRNTNMRFRNLKQLSVVIDCCF